MFNKSLTKTLTKVTKFVEELKSGIEANTAANGTLQEEINVLADKQKVNSDEIAIGNKLLSQLQ